MKISVVTVCYNAADTIEKTMLSVLNQTYHDIEYIIIDGGSTDGTVEIIRKYADRIAYWVSEPDKGIYDAMNKGIKVATGEWINFMNAGDSFVNSNVLDRLMNFHKDGLILYGNIIRIFQSYRRRATGIRTSEPKTIVFVSDTIHHQASLINSSLFLKYGYYSLDYKLMSDWLFYYETVVRHDVPVQYMDIDVAYFQMDGASTIQCELYKKEKRNYLASRLGWDILLNLEELTRYRQCKLSRVALDCRLKLKDLFIVKVLSKYWFKWGKNR